MSLETGIENLPDVVIEYIISHLSPYRDFKQCMLVNKAWCNHVRAVVKIQQREFHHAITNMSVQWSHQQADPGPTISKRYSHSACFCGDSMYVFGGCTTANTTFNDLWRLDLGTRCWIRPLATGTYPPPKACASLVNYKENLILFGGWTHTSPYPLHQTWRIFNHLHIYNTVTNRWTQAVTPISCPAMAGHSASIVENSVVVFGGLHRQGSHGPFSSSNDIWVLDLPALNWHKQITTTPQPRPRYGHSQIVLDDKHLLILGGCGGPNMLFSDVWLLTVSDDPEVPWMWQEMTVLQKENGAPHLSFHPASMVGNKVIVLNKSQKSRSAPSSLPQLLRAPSRTWVPPRGNGPRKESSSSSSSSSSSLPSSEEEIAVNGKKSFLKRHLERHRQHTMNRASSSDDEDSIHSRGLVKKPAAHIRTQDNAQAFSHSQIALGGNTGMFQSPKDSSACSELPSSLDGGGAILSPPSTSTACSNSAVSSLSSSSTNCRNSSHAKDIPSTSTALQYSDTAPSTSVGSSAVLPVLSNGLPNETRQTVVRPALSFRPAARSNRQRQLEGLDRMEQRLKNLRAGSRFPLSCRHRSSTIKYPSSAMNPMSIYVLDVSQAATHGQVTWLPIVNQNNSRNEEIILYSLVVGRGEVIMFGGIQKDLNSRQDETDFAPEVVSNSLHFISAKRHII